MSGQFGHGASGASPPDHQLDLVVEDYGFVTLLTPLNPTARTWLEKLPGPHVAVTALVPPQFAVPVMRAAIEAGLHIGMGGAETEAASALPDEAAAWLRRRLADLGGV